MAAATDRLQVRFGAQLVGQLDPGKHGRLDFTYDASWLANSHAFQVSLSLPLRAEPYADGRGHTFFSNLLPEGAVREAVCNRLGISTDNDVALLRAIGGECAGALSVVAADDDPPPTGRARYDALDKRRLQSLVSGDRVIPLLAGGPSTRLSLAGAQDKVPVAVLDGRIHLPIGGAPSTHILKLPHLLYAHIPVNEAFVTLLAARLGLDVVTAELFTQTVPPSLLVERYDRVRVDDPWPAVRLHQEDLCQALGLPPTRKYEQEGGPTLAAAIDLVRTHVRQPVIDVLRIIDWQAFNVCAGNSDGHGKNLSILYRTREGTLAPFYDLLSTRHYPKLDRALAMGVGGRRDPDKLGRAQWEALATELELGPRAVLERVESVAERCADLVTTCAAELRERHGAQSVLQSLPAEIVKRARRLRRALA